MADGKDITKTIKVVTVFLESKGFEAKKAVDNCEDGHWMLRACEAMENSSCLLCVDTWLKNLFTRLETGPFYIKGKRKWNRNCTNYALRQGGFEEWIEEAHE